MPEDPQIGPEPTPILEIAEVDSTNAEAMRRAAAGERGPLWISAVRQTAGRGRSGRSWMSLDGNLMATLLVAPLVPTRHVGELALVAGVAAHEAIGTAGPVPGLRLKWPNDILAGDAKVGGILVESTIQAGVTVAAVGFGINISVAPTVPGRPTTSLAAFGTLHGRAGVLAALAESMRHWLALWQQPGGFEAVRTAWLERAGPPGETTTINTGNIVLQGAFAGLDNDGALLIRDDGGTIRRFSFGDVTLGVEHSSNERGCHGS